MIRIGAIFTDDQKVTSWQYSLKTIFTFDFSQDSPTELAFKYAVYKINKDPHILANRYFHHLLFQEHQHHDWNGCVHLIPAHPRSLVFDIQYVPREDSFRTTNKVSQTLHKNTKSRPYIFPRCANKWATGSRLFLDQVTSFLAHMSSLSATHW